MASNQHILARVPRTSGLILGILPLPLHIFIPVQLSYELAAITLVLIAGVYVGYAFQDGRSKTILVELSGAAAFAGAAWLGLNGYPMVIVVALAAHGFWDLLHRNLITTDVPRWYIPFCAMFDWVMAAGLFLIWSIYA
jgi:hypothetical protein